MLKKILAEATSNFNRKRHNKNHLPASWQFPSASVNLKLKSYRQKLAAEVVKTTLRAESPSIFLDKSICLGRSKETPRAGYVKTELN